MLSRLFSSPGPLPVCLLPPPLCPFGRHSGSRVYTGKGTSGRSLSPAEWAPGQVRNRDCLAWVQTRGRTQKHWPRDSARRRNLRHTYTGLGTLYCQAFGPLYTTLSWSLQFPPRAPPAFWPLAGRKAELVGLARVQTVTDGSRSAGRQRDRACRRWEAQFAYGGANQAWGGAGHELERPT